MYLKNYFCFICVLNMFFIHLHYIVNLKIFIMRKNLDLDDDVCNRLQKYSNKQGRSFTKQLERLISFALDIKETIIK